MTSKLDNVMALADTYAEKRHVCGDHIYNPETAAARNALRQSVVAVAPQAQDVKDADRWRYAMDWSNKEFAVCKRQGMSWTPIKTSGPLDHARAQQEGGVK